MAGRAGKRRSSGIAEASSWWCFTIRDPSSEATASISGWRKARNVTRSPPQLYPTAPILSASTPGKERISSTTNARSRTPESISTVPATTSRVACRNKRFFENNWTFLTFVTSYQGSYQGVRTLALYPIVTTHRIA